MALIPVRFYSCASSCKGCQQRHHIRGFCKKFEKQLLFGCCIKVLKRVLHRDLLFLGRLGHLCSFHCAATPIKLFLESCGVYAAVIVQDMGISRSIEGLAALSTPYYNF